MVAKTFHQRPSDIARQLFPQLYWLTAQDWYALDVAAVEAWAGIYAKAQDDGKPPERHGPPGRESNAPRDQAPGTMIESGGQGLSIRGDEIPPWERR